MSWFEDIGHRKDCNCPCHGMGPDNEMYEPGECCFFCGCMPRMPTE
jgi:hypothetical protein